MYHAWTALKNNQTNAAKKSGSAIIRKSHFQMNFRQWKLVEYLVLVSAETLAINYFDLKFKVTEQLCTKRRDSDQKKGAKISSLTFCSV